MTKLKVAMVTLVLAAAAAAVPMFTQYRDNQKLKQENLGLREQGAQLAELDRVREENAQLTKRQSEVSKDLLELVRLRGQVDALKRQMTDLGKVKEDNARLRLQQSQAQAMPQPIIPQPQPADVMQQSCIANLKQLDGGKQQWALENKKTASDIPTFQDIIGEDKYVRIMPTCPAGGEYTLNMIQQQPQCSVEGHRIP